MTDNPKPERVYSYYIVTSLGDAISEKRPRESGAWANAAHKLGHKQKRDVEAAILDLKSRGCVCKKIEGVNVQFGVGVCGGDILHMRLNNLDAERINALVLHYSTKDNPVTKSWVIRHLIAEKVNRLSSGK